LLAGEARTLVDRLRAVAGVCRWLIVVFKRLPVACTSAQVAK